MSTIFKRKYVEGGNVFSRTDDSRLHDYTGTETTRLDTPGLAEVVVGIRVEVLSGVEPKMGMEKIIEDKGRRADPNGVQNSLTVPVTIIPNLMGLVDDGTNPISATIYGTGVLDSVQTLQNVDEETIETSGTNHDIRTKKN